MKFVPWKDYKAVAADLKRVYQSVTEEEALQELDEMEAKWVLNILKLAGVGDIIGPI